MGEKDEYLRRLVEICDGADGYQEEKSLSDKAEVNGELYEKVWKEAAGLRESGKKSYVLDKCGHTPWREKYTGEEFARVLFSELEG